MDSADPTLPGKYQKLLSEFSKLKNQLILLNRGLTEEQSSSKALREQLKEKDRLLKELREEADSREFRNQQLTRRVSVLQDELNQPSGVEQGHDSSTFSIFDAELTSKIREISNLHENMQRLSAENEALRDTNKEILLRHSDDQCMIKAQEDVIQQQKVMIDQLSQRHETPVGADHRTGSQSEGYDCTARLSDYILFCPAVLRHTLMWRTLSLLLQSQSQSSRDGSVPSEIPFKRLMLKPLFLAASARE